MKSYVEGSSGPPGKFIYILLFIGIFTAAFAALHVLIYFINARSIQNVFYLSLFKITLSIGVISIPIGFLCSRIKNKPLSVLTWAGYIWMGSFSILFFFTLIELVIGLITDHSYSFWPVYFSAFIIPIALFKGIKRPEITNYQIKSKNVPDFTLVQISDVHVGMLHIRGEWLVKMVHTILQSKPDVFCITGDLVEAEYSEIESDLNVLAQLKEIPHKFFITGNHEYIHGGSIWEKKLSALGFTVLHNSNQIIKIVDKKIMIAGVPDKMVKRFVNSLSSNPDKALSSNDIVDYKILLAHQPSSVFDLKNEKCDLILSGHTHGGQIFPFHLIVRLVQPVVSGFKKINGILVFAHQGTGFWGPPMRWYSRSEIAKFKFSNH